MPGLTRGSRCFGVPLTLLLLFLGAAGHKHNSIKTGGEMQSVKNNTQPRARNNPTQIYTCSSDTDCGKGSYCHAPHKGPSRCLACRRKKKHCQRDNMCCPGNQCTNFVCVPIAGAFLSPVIPQEHNMKLSAKGGRWRKTSKAKHSLAKGDEGDPCLRSSDCLDGFCCARHFWTKLCKRVVRRGEVCTRQRRKGSHGLELFQRCDCDKGLACKVWKDATASSKSRLHVCQEV